MELALLVTCFICTIALNSDVTSLQVNTTQTEAAEPKIINGKTLFTSKTNIPFLITFQIMSDPRVTNVEFRHYYLDMKIRNSSNFRTTFYTSAITLLLDGKIVLYNGIIAELKVSNFSVNLRGTFLLKVTNLYGSVVHVFKLIAQEDTTSFLEAEKIFITIVTVAVAMDILLLTTAIFIVLKILRIRKPERSQQPAPSGLTMSSLPAFQQNCNERNSLDYQAMGIIGRPPSADFSTSHSDGAQELSTFSTLHNGSREALERLPPGAYSNPENKGIQKQNDEDSHYMNMDTAVRSSHGEYDPLQENEPTPENSNDLQYQFLNFEEMSQVGDYDNIRTEVLPKLNTFKNVHSHSCEFLGRLSSEGYKNLETEGVPQRNTYTNVHSCSCEFLGRVSNGDYQNLETEDSLEQNDNYLHYQPLKIVDRLSTGEYDTVQTKELREVNAQTFHYQSLDIALKSSHGGYDTLQTEDTKGVDNNIRSSDLTDRSLSGNYDTID